MLLCHWDACIIDINKYNQEIQDMTGHIGRTWHGIHIDDVLATIFSAYINMLQKSIGTQRNYLSYTLPVTQLVPVYPVTQSQWLELILSTHVPPFWQGLLSHSLISGNGI